ncbi:hypothetical protein JW766_02095 [Candidatus Dojkabacteria bacterium]|nr:hypothetical protein [Candidatus Dojkabacteria bacterium]
MTITKRQEEILKRIIKEFMKTAQAVGSLTLSEKYDLGVSPATLRAEMSRLVEEGYLSKPHSSSGRIPTTLGIRYFLEEILREEEMEALQEAEIKEHLFHNRFQRSKFIKEAVNVLSKITNQTALSLVDDMVFVAGISQLVSNPEFYDINVLQGVLDIIESERFLTTLFGKLENDHLKILIGDEMGLEALEECSIVYAPFNYYRGEKGYLGVLGPRRMRYSKVIPAVRTVAKFLEEAITGWE